MRLERTVIYLDKTATLGLASNFAKWYCSNAVVLLLKNIFPYTTIVKETSVQLDSTPQTAAKANYVSWFLIHVGF